MLLGRKPEAIPVPAPAGRGGGEGGGGRGRGGLPGAGAQSDVFNRPTDVAWDAAGNIFVADGIGNARVAKFDSKGVFIKSWGSSGTDPGMFGTVTAIAVDAQGNVYAADGGNKRIQVFDNNGTFKTQFTNVGTPSALCMTPGPNQVLYSSNSNPPEDFDVGGEIYKMKLDGTIVGKFGKGREAAEGVRHRQLHRLPQREQPAGRRGRQHAGAEAHAAIGWLSKRSQKKDPRKGGGGRWGRGGGDARGGGGRGGPGGGRPAREGVESEAQNARTRRRGSKKRYGQRGGGGGGGAEGARRRGGARGPRGRRGRPPGGGAVARFANRGLPHRLGRRHAHHRRPHRQRQQVGA